jgi:putrescine transport system permease protein
MFGVRKSPFLLSVTLFVYAFLYLPIFFMIFFSFNSSFSLGKWSGFSFFWYKSLFKNSKLWECLFTSLKIAVSSATFSTLIGTLGALFSIRFSRSKGRKFFDFFSTIPLVIPEVIIGMAFLAFFVTSESLLGWPFGRGTKTITIAHTTLAIAYVLVVIRSRLSDFDVALEEAALDLGAKPFQVLCYIMLPFIFPALVSGWLLGFTLSMDDFVVASFTAGPDSTTLPMFLFSNLKTGLTPEINALSTLIVLFVAFLMPALGSAFYFSLKKKENLEKN